MSRAARLRAARRLVARLLLTLGVSGFGVVVATQAAAQPVAKTSADPNLKRAKELFDAGAREYEAGRYDGALQAFEQAYKLVPRDGIVFSMAQAHRRQYTRSNDKKHLVRAVALYKQYIDKVKSGGRVADAVKALGDIEPLMVSLSTDGVDPEAISAAEPAKTRIVVNIVAEGTMVSIDGGPPKAAPLHEEVKPGPHRVVLTAPGYFDEEREIVVGEGEIAPANLPQRERAAILALEADSGSAVSIDGRFVGETPLPRSIELPGGRHYVAVSKDGHESFGQEIVLGRATTKSLEVDLSSTVQRDSSYVVFISSGAVGVAAAVCGALAIEREATATLLLEAREQRALSRAEAEAYEDARDSRSLYTQLTFGLGGGAVGLLVLGTGLYVFDKPRPLSGPTYERPDEVAPPKQQEEDVEMTPSVAFGPDSFYAGVSGAF